MNLTTVIDDNQHVFYLNDLHVLGINTSVNDSLGAVLDTGFTGSAVASQKWFEEYQKYLCDKHNYGKIKMTKGDDQKFRFGAVGAKNCIAKAEIPIYLNGDFVLVTCSLISGNLELLLGRKFIDKYRIVIDSAGGRIKVGRDKWIAYHLNKKGLICLPIAPYDHKTLNVTRCERNRRRKKLRCAHDNSDCEVNQVSVIDGESNLIALLVATLERLGGTIPSSKAVPSETRLPPGENLEEEAVLELENGDSSPLSSSSSGTDSDY